MSRWEENIRKVIPYTPGEQPNQPDMIKLNTNENPYPPAPGVEKALREMDTDTMRLYPDPTAGELVHAIAKNYGLKDEQVFVGVGSDDVLAMSFLTFFNSQKPVLFPDITYSFYDVWADLFRIPYERPALDENFHIRKEDYFRENGGIVFPNPNAPTGVEMPLEEVEDIIRHNPDVIVIVDEAYVDFGGQSALPLIEKYDNLLVVQTFSKSRSMAGMRIGFACGNEKLIRFLNDVKYSFNSYTMDRTAIAAGVAAVEDKAYFDETCNKIIETREWTKKELKALGFSFQDSMSNFIFATHKTCPAKELFEALRGQHIYVRYFQKDRIDNFLRITVGTKEEMQKFIDFFEGLSEVKVRRFYGSTGTLVLAESVTIYFTGRGSFYYFNDSAFGTQGRIAAASLLKISAAKAIPLCIVGNIIPIPFILLFIRQIFKVLKKTKLFRGLVIKLEDRAMRKSDQVKKYEFWGLMLFVGIPLPGTGAWTGSLIASLLEIDIKKSSLAIFCGIIMATVIMYIVSYGLVGNLVH